MPASAEKKARVVSRWRPATRVSVRVASSTAVAAATLSESEAARIKKDAAERAKLSKSWKTLFDEARNLVTYLEGKQAPGGERLIAVDDGFLSLAGSVRFSPDGAVSFQTLPEDWLE